MTEYGFVKEYWKQFAEQKQVVLKEISTLSAFTTSYQEQLATKKRIQTHISSLMQIHPILEQRHQATQLSHSLLVRQM